MDTARMRRFLGILAPVLILAGPYIAGGASDSTSSSRRGRQAEEWMQGLQSMFGAAPAHEVGAVVAGWVCVALGLAAAIGWFLLGRRPVGSAGTAAVSAQLPTAAAYDPQQPWQPPAASAEPQSYGNPFNDRDRRQDGPRR